MCEMYAKDSLDRFGDDLCEELLSYLSLEDSFRYECVSKQWQRVVFRRQTVLSIDGNSVPKTNAFQFRVLALMRQLMIKFGRKYKTSNQYNWRRFETIVIKCANISAIHLLPDHKLEDKAIDLMIKHCDHLNYIPPDFSAISEEALDMFFARFGPQLKTFCFYLFNNYLNDNCIEKWVQMCVNLRSIQTCDHRLSAAITGEVVFKRLERFDMWCDSISADQLAVIVDRYGRQLKRLGLNTYPHFGIHAGTSHVVTLLNILANSAPVMAALVSLDLRYGRSADHILTSFMVKIGVNCPQLKSLSVDVYRFNPQLFRTISEHFMGLKRLRVGGVSVAAELVLTSDLLAPLKRLTRLEMRCYVCADLFLHNIGHNLPNIQYLKLKFEYYTDQSFTSLSELKQIRGITLTAMDEHWMDSISEWVINNLYKCPNICFIHLLDI